MKSEKRLIDANELKIQFLHYVRTEPHFHWGDWANMCIHGTEIDEVIANAQTVDAVPSEQFNALKSLINGEWVDCKLVQEALGIDFNTGFKMFDFSRTAEWNPSPLNGQKITTKFRLKNAAKVVHGHWIPQTYEDEFLEHIDYVCSECGCPHSAEGNFCSYCGADMGGDEP